jgi:spermidine/putrescine ABC transporter ATP-binding subunit
MVQRTSSLRIEGVSVRYGNNRAVENVSLTVNGGEFVSLLGPSGCGKTTLLRLIAGFLRPDGGRILCDDRDITTQAPYQRRFGVVFQNYALFPHMTAAENVGYGLKVGKVPRSEIAARVSRALDKVGLSNVGDRYPAQLSGGMQQRVALARALVIEPAILLLDEPLSALDKNMREEMQVELRLLQQNVGVTTVFVTHDQEEALTLSDRVAVMQSGRILQIGPPRDVYMHPQSQFVSTFLGTTNLLPGQVRAASNDRVEVAVEGHSLTATGQATIGSDVTVAVRPEHVIISSNAAGIHGIVQDVLFQGHRLIVIFVTKEGKEVRAFAPASFSLSRGQEAYAMWTPDSARILAD